MIKLHRVDDAFDTCRTHLNVSNGFNGPVDTILTSYVSAVIYASFEAKVREIVSSRSRTAGVDAHLHSFTRIAAKRLIRSIKISELAGTASFFDSSCKAKFGAGATDEEKAAWDAIVQNRHGVAHDGENENSLGNLTFHELESLYPKALKVLEVFESAVAWPSALDNTRTGWH
ncbi:HEPN domain-containing protein [Klenkia terrae]|uniref:HEPN domain-containing protein n=1 Tax=Klenkia terrae TaxID=1052259 RepID=A0ABU8ECX8_9ACTN